MIVDYSAWKALFEEKQDSTRRFFTFDLGKVKEELTDYRAVIAKAFEFIAKKYPESTHDKDFGVITIISRDRLDEKDEPLELKFNPFDIYQDVQNESLKYPRVLNTWIKNNAKTIFSSENNMYLCELYSPFSEYDSPEINQKIAENYSDHASESDLYSDLESALIKAQLANLFSEEEIDSTLEKFFKDLIKYIMATNAKSNIIKTPVKSVAYNKEQFSSYIRARVEENLVDFSSLSEPELENRIQEIANLLDYIVSINRLAQESTPSVGRDYVKLLDHLDKYPEILERIFQSTKVS